MNISAESASQKLARRIRALLAKAADPGVTEAEALAFGEKARELLEAHQLTLSDVELAAEGTLLVAAPQDRFGVWQWITPAIGRYCECRQWQSSASKQVKLLGLRSDAEFAGWLLSSLTDFVERQRVAFAFTSAELTPASLHDFMAGCGHRISERLDELTHARRTAAAAQQLAGDASGTALVVARSALVASAFAALGLTLVAGRAKSANPGASAFAAGRQAGNSAGFGRPVGASAAPKLLR